MKQPTKLRQDDQRSTRQPMSTNTNKIKVRALVVRESYIVIRTSKTKYRIALCTQSGSGYSNLTGGDIGLTGIKQYEFVSEPLTLTDLHHTLSMHYTYVQPIEKEI